LFATEGKEGWVMGVVKGVLKLYFAFVLKGRLWFRPLGMKDWKTSIHASSKMSANCLKPRVRSRPVEGYRLLGMVCRGMR
jgi:hypothetical protein